MIFRFLTSGESHGKGLTVIVDGVPSGVSLDTNFIDKELKRRQKGYGRGGRMKIETDKVEIMSGVRFGKATGAPVSLFIKNKDFENWEIVMSTNHVDLKEENKKLIDEKTITNVRPGHADFSGALKYDTEDIRNILERSSARETAARVAAGAIAKSILKEFHIDFASQVLQIGEVKVTPSQTPFKDKEKIENSEFHVSSKESEERLKAEIDRAIQEGDTLGGYIEVRARNIPIGLGAHTQWDKRLDGMIAQALMSIPAIKSVEIGLGKDVAQTRGSRTHDEIFVENEKFVRHTNNAGGIEGGMTNGEELVVKIAMKAIPTMKKPLNSVCLKTREEYKAHFERSDSCAVPSCAIVAEAMLSIALADAMFEKFSHDNISDMKKNFESYLQRINKI